MRKNTFVIQTDDDYLEKELSKFLSKHCKQNGVIAAVYELNDSRAKEVMEVVNKLQIRS